MRQKTSAQQHIYPAFDRAEENVQWRRYLVFDNTGFWEESPTLGGVGTWRAAFDSAWFYEKESPALDSMGSARVLRIWGGSKPSAQ